MHLFLALNITVSIANIITYTVIEYLKPKKNNEKRTIYIIFIIVFLSVYLFSF